MLTLGITGFSALLIVLSTSLKSHIGNQRILLSVSILMLLLMLMSSLLSKAPISQTFYGLYGRNTGVITYTSLIFVLLAAATLNSASSFSRIVKALLFSGFINLFYCMWVILFGDFIAWSNTYRNILGTLGNPNFIGSFLGIFLSSFVALAIAPGANVWLKRSTIFVVPVTFYEIMKSHAVQGRVVALLGVGIVLFFYIHAKFGKAQLIAYSVIMSGGAILSLLGAFQVGPLTGAIYKTSVSLRGQYWLAGWNTGQSHPLFGVGLDSFGDWYRRARSAHALVLPGVNTVVNAAHNVFMDIFASGGWPLLLAYLILNSITVVAFLQTARRIKTYDPIFVALLTAWLGYEVQSVISINQIGLAIWGWVLGGSLIAYERTSRPHESIEKPVRGKIQRHNQFEPTGIIFGVAGGIIGLLVALPPLSGDAKWRSAQMSRSANLLEESLIPSYFNPPNSMKYVVTIDLLERNNLFDLSHKTAIEAVKFNPDAFELWKMLYLLRNSSEEEKALALTNMKRLDPLNPNVTG
jgi:O-antigen ligase